MLICESCSEGSDRSEKKEHNQNILLIICDGNKIKIEIMDTSSLVNI